MPEEEKDRMWKARGRIIYPQDSDFHKRSCSVKARAKDRDDAESALKHETVRKLGCAAHYVAFVRLQNVCHMSDSFPKKKTVKKRKGKPKNE
jgi:hypothetical protein